MEGLCGHICAKLSNGMDACTEERTECSIPAKVRCNKDIVIHTITTFVIFIGRWRRAQPRQEANTWECVSVYLGTSLCMNVIRRI